MNLFELFVKIGVDDQASGKLKDLGGKLGNGLATAAKIGTAAVGAAAAGITALTTAAVNNYAEYEQLIGGVETLYGAKYKTIEEYIEGTGAAAEYAEQTFAEYQKRQQAVLDNAANAYKTAGMSANEYMNTVNGFAASLTNSLGEYEWQAASYADMIVSDMADNANKMGTSMDMIQNAYAGFAKQNYTMLDNLKLGYGGTKTEMERLLRDAERMAGYIEGSLDIESFADIADAIHIVQEEMGITGTTALEAGRTISGSVGSMKAAWQNLLTGFANGNADLETLVEDLVTTIVGDGTENNLGVLGNIMPAVKMALKGAAKVVAQAAPIFAEQLPVLIEEILPDLASATANLIVALAEQIPSMAQTLVDAAFQIADEICNAFAERIPGLSVIFENLETVVVSLTAAFAAYKAATAISGIIDALRKATEGQTLAQAALNAIMNANPFVLVATLIAAVGAALVTLYMTNEDFRNKVNAAWSTVKDTISNVISALKTFFTTTLPNAIDTAVDWLANLPDKFREVGANLLEGLWNGITDKVEWLKGKVSGVVDIIKGWFTGKDGFDEHSPSKWSKQVFRYVMEGGGEGLDAGLPGLMQSVGSVTDRVKSGLDFGTASVDFASSGLGVSSAGIINTTAGWNRSAGGFTGPIELILKSDDGQQLGRWMVPFVRSENRSNPEVVSDA